MYSYLYIQVSLSAISSCNLEISANPSKVNSEILRLRRLYNIIVQLVADLVFSYSVQIFCQHDIVGHNSTIMIVHSTSNKTDPKVKKTGPNLYLWKTRIRTFGNPILYRNHRKTESEPELLEKPYPSLMDFGISTKNTDTYSHTESKSTMLVIFIHY